MSLDVFHVYKDDAGEWRWRRKAGNGDITADSGEGYEHRTDAIAAAERESEGQEVQIVVDEA